ncbi:ATP-binding protein [Xanthobacter sp. V2C-8]|uniref:ATP-binding protein n=1 Tax=Xanthobacter albus TaxID=3119929 RepID=UPI00372BAC29
MAAEPTPARVRSGPVTLLLAALLVLMACLPFLATLGLYAMYSRQIMQQQEANAKKVAELLLKNFEQTVDAADALLLNFASAFDSDWTPEQTQHSLNTFSLPRSIVQLAVVGRNGIMVASNAGGAGTAVDLSDREHVRVHADRGAPAGGLFISKPVLGRVSGQWTVQLTRPLTDAEGRFFGVAVASYAVTDFVDFYRNLRTDDDMLISLVGFDGIIRARAARHTSFGDDVSRSPAFRRAVDNKQSVYEFTSPLDGVERVGYMVQSDRYPFYVTVAYSLAFVRAHSDEFRAAILGTGAALGIVLLLLGLLASRHLRIRKRLEARELEAAARRRETEMLNAISRVPGVSVMHLTAAGPVAIGTPGDARLARMMGCYLAGARFQAIAGEITAPVVRSEQLAEGAEALEVEMVIAPLWNVDTGGSGRELVIFAVDQTARRMEENKLHQVLKLASLGELATGLAHEINQPLSVIRLAASNALTAAQRGQPAQQLVIRLERIVQQAMRMRRIVDHMRLFGRKSDAHMQPCAPAEAVEGALEVVGPLFRRDGVRVITRIEPDLPQVLCHQDQLEQVLINLLQNARDAVIAAPGTEGDDARRVWIDASAEHLPGAPPCVRIDVRDEGGGVSPAIIDRVFEPFFTTKPPGQGTGLGLSVSFGIIRNHGGGLSVRNDREGAVFSIRLPAEARTRERRRAAGA